MNLRLTVLMMFMVAPMTIWAQKDKDKVIKSIDNKAD